MSENNNSPCSSRKTQEKTPQVFLLAYYVDLTRHPAAAFQPGHRGLEHLEHAVAFLAFDPGRRGH